MTTERRQEASGFIRDFELSALRDCLSGEARDQLIEALSAMFEETDAEQRRREALDNRQPALNDEPIPETVRLSEARQRRRDAVSALRESV